MSELYCESRTNAKIKLLRMKDVQDVIDNFDPEYITPAKLLTAYIYNVVDICVCMEDLDPVMWEKPLLEVINTPNYIAQFGATSNEDNARNVATVIEHMSGDIKFGVEEHYRHIVLNGASE